MTGLFHQIEGENVILRTNGVFKQADVYWYNKELFAKSGSGFIRLLANQQTSVPKTFWESLTFDKFKEGQFGRLLQE